MGRGSERGRDEAPVEERRRPEPHQRLARRVAVMRSGRGSVV